ncbi:MAG: Na+/proline symporter [Chloroflexi bacterium]|nr:Na+/proline symporter [Chloroflexota bacterium]
MSTGAWAFLVAVATMAGMAGMGIWYTRGRSVSVEDFISARRSTSGLTAMATAVASVMGAWILFSPAEAATWAGLVGIIGYGLGQTAPIVAFAILGPRMRRIMPEGHSLTEFVWFRYGRATYAVVLVITLLYMFTFLSAEMGAIARAVRLVTDAPLLLTLVLVGGATLAYTVYGGLRASIFTDNLQFLVMVPLLVLLLAVAVSRLGGWSGAFDPVQEVAPALLSLSHRPGIEFGITLIIAILAANLFHQGFWQRVYAARTDGDLRLGFLGAGVIVLPMVIAAGLFGLWAVGRGLVTPETPGSIALFTLALEVLPGWALVALTALALALVMSSMDTLLNGLASVFTTDLPRIRPGLAGPALLRSSRIITALLIVPSMAVGYAFDSVLYLFLIADLVCAGAVVPVFLGMYARRFSGTGAAVSAISGIAAGAVFFPTRSLAGWWTLDPLTSIWHILASGNLLGSFFVAVAVSSVVAAGFAFAERRRPGAGYDFEALSRQVHSLEG